MNNDSILINNYLQHEMNDEERTAFEKRLVTDTALQNELRIQQQIINAIVNAGMKNEFASAMRKRIIVKRMITWTIAAVAATVAIILLLNINQRNASGNDPANIDNVTNEQQIKNILAFINPPLPKINVPFSEYVFDAQQGETIYYNSGSIIHFPPSAFIDEANNIIKGMVKISYREFADPLDFFVSGIPMQYDSAGKKYNFESSGMCEINAFKDNKAVFVNPNAKPEINLSVTNKSALHNLYFLDTAKRSWEFIGKDVITEVKNISNDKTVAKNTVVSEYIGAPVKPMAPRKADDTHQAFSIEVDPNSFTELLAYDHLKFEAIDVSPNMRSDANEEWQDVKLDRTSTEGIYNVTFTNPKRKVAYKVRPVLEGENYDAALKVFKEKNIAYEQALKERLQSEKNISDTIAIRNKKLTDNINADKEWNEKMNALIVSRNKKMRALMQMKISTEEKIAIAEQQKIQDQLLLLNRNQWKTAVDIALSEEVIRTFTINNFGVWNCDHPQYPKDEVPVYANYTDSLNNKIFFPNTAVVYKGFNGITQFPSQMQIRIIPGKENMLWSIKDSSFYYFTYKDFADAGIKRDTKEFTFKMRKADKPVSSYEEIRELVGKL
ncbi:MAG: hypothetical protein ABI402_12440 [Ferruginibacter sp.]